MSQALKSTNPVESTTSDQFEQALSNAIAPAIASELVSLEKFDVNKHSAKKYTVTMPSGQVEVTEDLREIIDGFFDSDLYAWANDAFDRNPSSEELERYIGDNEQEYLEDQGCMVTESFDWSEK